MFHLVGLLVLALFAACSAGPVAAVKPAFALVGSTPGGPEVKMFLGIDEGTPVDFIRWQLAFDDSRGTFDLNVHFGEGQPNTNGFKGGGTSRNLTGTYTIAKKDRHTIFVLNSSATAGRLKFIELDRNTFHVLTAGDRLLDIDGGWSYTLHRRDRADDDRRLVSRSKSVLHERSREMVFVGRTPCVDFQRLDLEKGADCAKLKWKLTFYRDAQTGRPTEYKLESTVSRLKPVTGTWALVNGTHTHPEALLIQLDVNEPTKTISFFVADDNVMFLMDKKERLLVGNDDFSFTLNRRQPDQAVKR